jgi:hypothetical protein
VGQCLAVPLGRRRSILALFGWVIVAGGMGAASIFVPANAAASRLVDSAGVGSSALFSLAGADNEPQPVSFASGGEISSSSIVCAGEIGYADGPTGCGGASNKKLTQKKVPTVTAPTTPTETRWGNERNHSWAG